MRAVLANAQGLPFMEVCVPRVAATCRPSFTRRLVALQQWVALHLARGSRRVHGGVTAGSGDYPPTLQATSHAAKRLSNRKLQYLTNHFSKGASSLAVAESWTRVITRVKHDQQRQRLTSLMARALTTTSLFNDHYGTTLPPLYALSDIVRGFIITILIINLSHTKFGCK